MARISAVSRAAEITGAPQAGSQKKAGPEGPAEKHRKLCQEETNNERKKLQEPESDFGARRRDLSGAA
jgi:hypothetical protein